ncbi:MAG: polysaccharide deacetylase family protein [Bacteroidetes bacterium]|nr:polysaccharide deacetylase family protein [Bacteroidota bacterium]
MYKPFIQPPELVRRFYPKRLWRMNPLEKSVYLTFDDGPHPEITPFVLEQLAHAGAKASFFCIGSRVAAHPLVYRQILEQGHRVGNHTHQHVNAWQVNQQDYLNDVATAAKLIDSNLFRPPYGKLPWHIAKQIPSVIKAPAQIVMWDILSGDFDQRQSATACFENCRRNIRSGSIIVLHDSEKAWGRLAELLPTLISFTTSAGYSLKALP